MGLQVCCESLDTAPESWRKARLGASHPAVTRIHCIHWQLLAGRCLRVSGPAGYGIPDRPLAAQTWRGPRWMSLRDAAVYSCLESDVETGVLGAEGRGWNSENGRFIPSIGGLVRVRVCMHCKSPPAFPYPAPANSRWRSTPSTTQIATPTPCRARIPGQLANRDDGFRDLLCVPFQRWMLRF